MEEKPPNQTQHYILGHADDELGRLIYQARYFGDLTGQLLRRAGLDKGMRVLDVGCGAGDVAFLAASMVGPQGMVIGVDRSPEAVTLASQRSATAGLANLQFLTRDLTDFAVDVPVDALIGRLVLMYFPDPATVLRHLLRFVKPNGLVIFQELDVDGAKSEPPSSVFTTAIERVKQTFIRAGADVHAGLKLGRIFEEAGLPAPEMMLGARVERGPDALAYDQLTQITRTLLPLMQRTGIATPEEVGLETLADRIRDEAVALNATLVSPSLIGAWARTPLG